MLQVAVAMVTVLLSHTALGQLAWVRILGGSLIGTAIAIGYLARRYPLLALMQEAEVED
jgi:hypothetical protein